MIWQVLAYLRDYSISLVENLVYYIVRERITLYLLLGVLYNKTVFTIQQNCFYYMKVIFSFLIDWRIA